MMLFIVCCVVLLVARGDTYEPQLDATSTTSILKQSPRRRHEARASDSSSAEMSSASSA